MIKCQHESKESDIDKSFNLGEIINLYWFYSHHVPKQEVFESKFQSLAKLLNILPGFIHIQWAMTDLTMDGNCLENLERKTIQHITQHCCKLKG